MQQSSAPLFNRPDTLLGVCEGLGQDFGFNPLYLRVSLAVLTLWNPVAIISLYIGLGVAVAISRLIVPTRARGPRAKEGHNVALNPLETTITEQNNEAALPIAA